MNQSQIDELRQARYNATVDEIDFVHSDLMKLRIKPDFAVPKHMPGQYCSLGLGYWESRVAGCQEEKVDDATKVVLRPYSLSHRVLNTKGQLQEPADTVDFYIVLVRENKDGRVPALTPRLFNLKKGDRLKMFEKITGGYTLEPVKPGDAVVFLSTGTGEAPHNFMLWDLLRKGHTGPIVAACCVRKNNDIGYRATHGQLMEQHKNYKYLPLATREEGVPKRYIQDLIESGELAKYTGGTLNPEKTHVFLCGNPSMIGVPVVNKETNQRTYPTPVGVIELLEKKGFKADHKASKFVGSIHFEEYW